MKINHLKQIIEQMYQKVLCPQCKKEFSGNRMDMTRVSDNSAEFKFCCPHCGTNSVVQAQLENPKRITQRSQQPDMRIPIQESDEDAQDRFTKAQRVRQMSQDVKDFGGQDVRELFE